MGITKNALIRYQVLDKCFRNPGKRFSITNLLEACNSALFDFDFKSDGIKKRQLYDDIRFMESPQGYDIPLERIKDGRNVFFRYEDLNFSITNKPLNELEAEQLKSAIMVLRRFKGLPQFEWISELIPKLDQTFKLSNHSQEIMSFDSNEFLKGAEYLAPLFNAILYKQTLNITYKSFKSDKSHVIVLYPYHLKQFNNRWFLFGKNEEYDNLTNLALDRIISIKESKEPYISNIKINFEEYFDDFIGVSKTAGLKLIKITLLAKPSLAPYIKTKPIHGSQRKIEDNETGFKFSIEVIPNYELEKMLLSFGEDITVIAPAEFRDKIKGRITKNLNNYN